MGTLADSNTCPHERWQKRINVHRNIGRELYFSTGTPWQIHVIRKTGSQQYLLKGTVVEVPYVLTGQLSDTNTFWQERWNGKPESIKKEEDYSSLYDIWWKLNLLIYRLLTEWLILTHTFKLEPHIKLNDGMLHENYFNSRGTVYIIGWKDCSIHRERMNFC